MPDPKQTQTLQQLEAALAAYENNSVVLIDRAFQEGGAQAVDAVEREYQALQHSYYELLNRQLMTNSANYANLMDQTIAATRGIESSISNFETIAKVLGAMKRTVDLVGRALILFGI